jgi:hypothetical protein
LNKLQTSLRQFQSPPLLNLPLLSLLLLSLLLLSLLLLSLLLLSPLLLNLLLLSLPPMIQHRQLKSNYSQSLKLMKLSILYWLRLPWLRQIPPFIHLWLNSKI